MFLSSYGWPCCGEVRCCSLQMIVTKNWTNTENNASVICYSTAGNNLRCWGLNGTRSERPAGLMLSLSQAAIKSWFSGFLVMINNSDPGCNISARPVYLVLQCLQCLQWQHPGTRVRLPRTLQSCCKAGVCSVCTPGLLQCCSHRPLWAAPLGCRRRCSVCSGPGMRRGDGLGRMERSTFTLSKTETHIIVRFMFILTFRLWCWPGLIMQLHSLDSAGRTSTDISYSEPKVQT